MDEPMVTHNFPIIKMGLGEVEVGDATHGGLPALWFGTGGRGLDAPEMVYNRPAHDNETLVLFTFCDIRGLEAIEKACARVRLKITQSYMEYQNDIQAANGGMTQTAVER